jgi:hypothetical protein
VGSWSRPRPSLVLGPPLLVAHAEKFGGDDETVFHLITGQSPAQPMPVPDEEIWKILASIRSLDPGDSSTVNW